MAEQVEFYIRIIFNLFVKKTVYETRIVELEGKIKIIEKTIVQQNNELSSKDDTIQKLK